MSIAPETHGRVRSIAPFAGAALSLAAGGSIIFAALKLPPSRTADVGEGRLPLLIGILIIGLSVAYGMSAFRSRGPDDAADGRGRANVTIVFGMLAGYCALIPFVGMIAATVSFMVAAMLWRDGWNHWLRSATSTAIFAALIYALFTWVIAQPLP